MYLNQRRLGGAVGLGAFVLLLLTVPACLWAAGTDLPLGGPNVFAGGLAVLASLFYVALFYLDSDSHKTFVQPFLPVIPILAIGSLLLAWAATVYLATDTLAPRRLGQMAIGLGILFAVFCCVTSSRRAYGLVLAIVLATFVSTVFGFGIAFYGDPFLTIWLRLADDVPVSQLPVYLTYKRLTGLSSDAVTFSYQLAIAIPLAFALLLHGWPGGARCRRTLDAVIGIVLMVMITGMIVNASRSLILGASIGVVVIAAIHVKARQPILRLAVIGGLIACWVAVFFNPTLAVDRFIFPDEPRIAVSDLDALADAPPGTFEWKLAKAYEALLLSDRRLAANQRLFRLMDSSTRPRPHMFTAAVRYALDYPLGTGRYYPSEAHLDTGLDDRTKQRVLTGGPHNQFLVVLVYYGFPGLILLTAFYLQMLRPLWPAFRGSLGPEAGQPAFLVPGVIGALIAYGINSLLHNAGPFVGDWYHFILVGLAMALANVSGSSRSVDRSAP